MKIHISCNFVNTYRISPWTFSEKYAHYLWTLSEITFLKVCTQSLDIIRHVTLSNLNCLSVVKGKTDMSSFNNFHRKRIKHRFSSYAGNEIQDDDPE